MTTDLFAGKAEIEPREERLAPGAVVLRQYAVLHEAALLAAIRDVAAVAPFRHMVTPGGFRMSAAMTNCGALGWVTDETGYRYAAADPETGCPWPELPEPLVRVA